MSENVTADWITDHLGDHVATAQAMDALLPTVDRVAQVLIDAYAKGGILYTFGNGGSAADAQHLTGELIGHYKRDRRPLPAVTLTTDATVSTCIANDYSFDDVFGRQVEALARPGDVVAAFTTSGKSPNVVAGLEAGRRRGAITVLFSAGDGGPAAQHADHLLLVPSATAPARAAASPISAAQRTQEMHTLMLHLVSEAVDAWAAEESLA